MEILATVMGYGLGTLGMICLGMAFFVRILGSMARRYQMAEAPAKSGSTGGCFFTTMMIVFLSVSLVFFSLAAYVSGVVV